MGKLVAGVQEAFTVKGKSVAGVQGAFPIKGRSVARVLGAFLFVDPDQTHH